MISLLVKFLISIVIIWLLVMYNIWKEKNKIELGEQYKVLPVYNKIKRTTRRGWFTVLRFTSYIKDKITLFATKLFFRLFPRAKKIFETKDKLTGLEHGPSSYFLKSLSNEKSDIPTGDKNNRRKSKNV